MKSSNMIEKLKNIFNRYKIGEPPWEYNFLVNLPKTEYPKYLAKIFNYRTGEKLPLKYDFKQHAWIIDKKRCKTFNQKIQWIKLNFCRVVSPDSISGVRTRSGKKSAETHKGVNNIMDTFGSGSKDFNEKNSGYGVTDLMRQCTDKVAVREYVAEKIGSEYLKPVLQVCESFDEIDFNNLPNAFVMKCNHGCKWQYIIKNKEQFLNTPQLIEIVKKNMTGWLEQNYSFWGGFEMQYKGIEPKILIEELLRNNNQIAQEVEIYCFNGIPKILKKVHNDIPDKLTMYDERFNCIDLKFQEKEILVDIPIDELIKQTFILSKQLSQ